MVRARRFGTAKRRRFAAAKKTRTFKKVKTGFVNKTVERLGGKTKAAVISPRLRAAILQVIAKKRQNQQTWGNPVIVQTSGTTGGWPSTSYNQGQTVKYLFQPGIMTANGTAAHLNNPTAVQTTGYMNPVFALYPQPLSGTTPNATIGNYVDVRTGILQFTMQLLSQQMASTPSTRSMLVRWVIVKGRTGVVNAGDYPTPTEIFGVQDQGVNTANYDSAYFRNWNKDAYRLQYMSNSNIAPKWVIVAEGSHDLNPQLTRTPVAALATTNPVINSDWENDISGGIFAISSGVAAATTGYQTLYQDRNSFADVSVDISTKMPYGGNVKWADTVTTSTGLQGVAPIQAPLFLVFDMESVQNASVQASLQLAIAVRCMWDYTLP